MTSCMGVGMMMVLEEYGLSTLGKTGLRETLARSHDRTHVG